MFQDRIKQIEEEIYETFLNIIKNIECNVKIDDIYTDSLRDSHQLFVNFELTKIPSEGYEENFKRMIDSFMSKSFESYRVEFEEDEDEDGTFIVLIHIKYIHNCLSNMVVDAINKINKKRRIEAKKSKKSC